MVYTNKKLDQFCDVSYDKFCYKYCCSNLGVMCSKEMHKRTEIIFPLLINVQTQTTDAGSL